MNSTFDLLRAPVIGRILRWRHARTLSQVPLLLLGVFMVLHGLLGPSLAPRNLATTLTWVHFRGALVLVLLIAGNFFCFACPFVLIRDAARKFFRPARNFPRYLRNKWLSALLLVSALFLYELFDLWSSPWWTAIIILSYFLLALIVDSIFKHAAFCKFVCPIGQFNFLASTISPLEVRVRDQEVCTSCKTKDCIRGRREQASAPVVIQRGCELALFQPRKIGNLDCTFCLDCVQACPHDNVGIIKRVPASELTINAMRSGVGILSRRPDLATLSIVFVFAGLLNAFAMVSPIYIVESWLAARLNTTFEAPVLGVIFIIALIIEPVILLGAAVSLTLLLTGRARSPMALLLRYSYSLVPLGFGIWLAHYSFHFLTGLYTFIPVIQSAFLDLGWSFLGGPWWRLTGLQVSTVQAFEFGFVILGLLGSLLVSYRLAEQDSPLKPMRAFVPWAGVATLLFLSAIWLLMQPMEMRATMLGG